MGTHSSAPSSVTSMVGNWSTSPRFKPDETMSSLDWKPSPTLGQLLRVHGDGRTGGYEDALLVRPCPELDNTLYNIRYRRTLTFSEPCSHIHDDE